MQTVFSLSFCGCIRRGKRLVRRMDQRFEAVMDNDFNTPKALAVLFDLAKAVFRYQSENRTETSSLANTLVKLGNILGLLGQNPEQFLQQRSATDRDFFTLIESKIAEREDARRNADWARADSIREWLDNQNIEIEDAAGKTHWRIRRPVQGC